MLEDVHLALGEGEFVAVAGPNGGGKTTLVRLLLGLERPSSRRGAPVRRARSPLLASSRARIPRAAFRGRRRRTGDRPGGRLRRRLASGRLVGRLRRSTASSSRTRSARVGLDEVADASLRTLSGGMQQRAFIAKALAARPTLLVLDEPTTGVDAESQESLAALLSDLHRELGVTVVYVSHEFGAVEQYVERLVLVRRTIVFDGSPHDLPGVWHDPGHVHARE